MNDEIIWIGNIVRVGSNTPRYLYNEDKDYIEFRTIKNKCELGYLDKRTGIFYVNYDYRMNFKAIKRQIIKDYAPKTISQYISLEGDF